MFPSIKGLLLKGGNMGPFHTPWLTFSAWIVALVCVIFSIIWAVWIFKVDEDTNE